MNKKNIDKTGREWIINFNEYTVRLSKYKKGDRIVRPTFFTKDIPQQYCFTSSIPITISCRFGLDPSHTTQYNNDVPEEIKNFIETNI